MARFYPIPQKGRRVKEYPLDSAAAFKNGAATLLASDEEVEECGADPAAVLGFAEHPAAGRDVNPTKQLVALAVEGATFLMAGDDAPTINDVNQQYGIVKDAAGIWGVDGTDTSNVVVEVVGVDLLRNLYEVSVLASVRQLPT